MKYFLKFILFFCIFVIYGCSDRQEPIKQVSKIEQKQSPEKQTALVDNVNIVSSIPTPCGNDGLALNDIVAVSKEFLIRTSPSSKAPKIKNEKASEMLGEDHFHSIDNSTTVRRLCVQSEWTEIQIATPDWLTHVRGWTPNNTLREIEHSKSGDRIYVETDFSWDSDTSKYKNQIISIVNRISRENQNCKQIDTASIAKSVSKSNSNRIVFYVSCGSGINTFNVYFEPKDADSKTKFLAKTPIERSSAINACEAAAKQAAAHPSTVNFSRILDLSYIPHKSGRARVVSTFKAKNSFNLELQYQIDCLFDGQYLLETNIAEVL